MKPILSIIACATLAGLSGCATFGRNSMVYTTGTKGDCGYQAPEFRDRPWLASCDVTISVDEKRAVTFTPETLTVHFNASMPQEQTVTWTLAQRGEGTAHYAFTPTGGIIFAQIDGDGGPFHSAHVGIAKEGARLLRSPSLTVTDSCGQACKDSPPLKEGRPYAYGLILYDNEGTPLKTLDPGLVNSAR